MTIVVIGGTGTLGRQIIKQLLNNGYSVRCLVRNIKKAEFLREWGAELIYGDIKLPETIPNALLGIKIIVDVSTLRNEDELVKLNEIDLIGKICLIKAAKTANIEKFIFFSIKNNERFLSVPLLKLKNRIENILKSSKISYKIFQLSGFYQGIINQYAIPILEQRIIYITKDSNQNSYIDTQDISKICVKSLILDVNDNFKKGDIIELNGEKNWSSNTILRLCEELPGQTARISFISLDVLIILKKILSLAKWTWDIHDRLAFTEFIAKDSTLENQNNYPCNINIYSQDMISLENYLQEYFEGMLKKLKDLNYEKNQILKRKNLTF